MIDKENSHVIAKSYTNLSDNLMAIDELKEECSKKHITPTIPKLKKLSHKFSNSSVNRKSLVSLKQSRIHFKNTKSKNTIDISKSNSFLGGVRNLTDEISKKDFEKKPVPLLKVKIKRTYIFQDVNDILNLNEFINTYIIFSLRTIAKKI